MTTEGNEVVAARDELRLRWLLELVRAQWLVMGAVALLGTAIGVSAIFWVEPAYRAEATLIPMRRSEAGGLGNLVKGLGGLAGVVGSRIDLDGGHLEQDLALIRSRAFTLQFVREQQLLTSLFDDRWDAAAGQWRASGRFGTGKRRPPSSEQIVRRFDARRQIVWRKEAGVVFLRLEWGDADTAAKLTNALVAAANKYARARVATEAGRSIEYLNRQLEQSNTIELREMLYSLYEEETKRAMLAEVRDDFILQIIDPAMAPERPVRPRPLMYTAAGMFAGALIGLALAILRLRRAQRG